MGDIFHIDEERECREKESGRGILKYSAPNRNLSIGAIACVSNSANGIFVTQRRRRSWNWSKRKTSLADAISEYATGISEGAPPIDEALERRINAAMALLNELLLETPFEWTPQGYRFQEEESRRRNSSE